MMNKVRYPGKVGIPGRWSAELPALIVPKELTAPVGVIEGRIGQHIIRLEIGVQIAMKGVSLLLTEVAVDAANGQVHLGQPPGGVV